MAEIICKHFKIAMTLGLIPLVPDTMTHVLIADDADTYLVARPRHKKPWPLNGRVAVPFRSIPLPLHGCNEWVPQWSGLGVVQAHRYSLLRPADVVGRLFSEGLGCRLLPHRCPDDPYDEQTKMGMDVPFDISQFSDAASMNAGLKSLIANGFVRFAMGGFQKANFDPLIYMALPQMFDMGPILSAKEFYERWFGSAAQRLITCRRIAEFPVVGDPSESLCDLERTIQYVVIRFVLRAVAGRSATKRANLERRLLIKLLRRHGMPSTIRPRDPATA